MTAHYHSPVPGPGRKATYAGVLGGAALLMLVGALWVTGVLSDVLTPAPPEVVEVGGVEPGAPLATYLSDGTPVWVVEHSDGELELVSAFDAHRPSGIRQLVWWCPSSNSFEGPDTGAKYDEYGAKYDGPAPSGLVTWPLQVTGDRAEVGDARPAPSIGTPYVGPPSQERMHCFGEDDLILHTFETLARFDSPSALVAASPDGWSLLAGELVEGSDGPMVCALSGCGDAAPVRGAEVPPPEIVEIQPAPDRLWLVRVDGDHLVDLTRTINREALVRRR